MAFAEESDDILQPTEQIREPVGPRSTGVRLDADLDASELFCFCCLCLGRDISDVPTRVDASFNWTIVPDTGSLNILENSDFDLRYPRFGEGNVDSKLVISYGSR